MSKSGKVKFKHAYARHMFTAKNPSQKSRLRRTGILAKADAEKIKIMMPYGVVQQTDNAEYLYKKRTELRCLAQKADPRRAAVISVN